MRIGFACKYVHPDRTLKKSEINAIESTFNGTSTTLRWCKENPLKVEQRFHEIIDHNISSIFKLIKHVSSMEKTARMLRISGDILPLYTHADYSWVYQKSVLRDVEKRLFMVGEYARQHDVRLSMHPGQFVVLASENPDIVKASIKEFEYHAMIIRMMGYGKQFQDFKCNVHLSGKGGESVFRKAFSRLSVEARNTITIENDEYSKGLDDVLLVSDIVPIVMDIHHHWVHSSNYIRPHDDRVRRVIESWRGKRPTLHYAYSRQEVLLELGHDDNKTKFKPCFNILNNKRLLRAHSDFYPNKSANRWALSFLPEFDIMCEAKMKNLASAELIKQAVREGYV